ncbi:urease accessory protein UreG (modular protein) [Modestobacter italicus]|uniref:Urease accessory protein UreG (Modular protein) n=2 Tax=Modestobacter italicus (strain DSM 44449 / CECT 9708 / BC 501) TaxID=2732864 RepID=I4EYK2_MODI5|nr:urease accessory protein UreG (modular protein) [Modestobacter marinus]
MHREEPAAGLPRLGGAVPRVGIGGPVGSGKTALIEALVLLVITDGHSPVVVTNDIVTSEDAQHVRATLADGLDPARVVGVETGSCPHTAVRDDPTMNFDAVEELTGRFPEADLVLLESGGDNLTLTYSPALAGYIIFVIDVGEGDKIPRKRGPGVNNSDLLVINKIDIAPHVRADRQSCNAMRAPSARAGRSCSPTASPAPGCARSPTGSTPPSSTGPRRAADDHTGSSRVGRPSPGRPGLVHPTRPARRGRLTGRPGPADRALRWCGPAQADPDPGPGRRPRGKRGDSSRWSSGPSSIAYRRGGPDVAGPASHLPCRRLEGGQHSTPCQRTTASRPRICPIRPRHRPRTGGPGAARMAAADPP